VSEQEQPIWVFDIGVHGPFVMQGRFLLDEVDAFLPDEPFFLHVEVKSAPHGAQLSCKVTAETGVLAQQLALVYVDQWLDVLSAQSNLPLFSSRQEARPFGRDRFPMKRALEKHEWQNAFRETHHFRAQEGDFLRALGLYRKALCEENPIERYGLFCEAILQAAPAEQDHSAAALQRHVLALCTGLWGEISSWPDFLRGDKALHGLLSPYLQRSTAAPLLPSAMNKWIDKLPQIHRLAHTFLAAWRNQKIEVPGHYTYTSIHHDTGWGQILH